MQQPGPSIDAPVGKEMHRLFFALCPDSGVRARIVDAAAALKEAQAPRGRWIAPHRYHLTLQFLGDFDAWPESLVERATAAATAAAVATPAFELRLDRAGSFRNRAIPWWLGCVHVPDGLQQLWEGLGRALAHADVRVARSDGGLEPHVTILRDAGRALPSTPIAPIRWPVRQFMLLQSVLGPRSAYRELGRWTLGTD